LLKDLKLKVVSELMKNSRRSDREIAKELGVSQPTVSRIIASLEKEGVLKEYTVIPDFLKLGYNIVAITFGNINQELHKKDEIDNARKEFVRSFDDSADEVVADVRGLGLGHDGSIVSFHRNYSEYADFKRRLLETAFVDPTSIESFLIDLNDPVHHRKLTFSYLAKHLLQESKTDSKK